MATNTRGGWRTISASIYIHCAVPCCNSNTHNSTKFFVKVPNQPALRVRWFKLAKIEPYSYCFDDEIHFCQDHFDVGSKGKSKNFIGEPTKFECQYFKEELDPADGPLITEDGIYKELLCFENCTEEISPSSPILASSPEYQTPNSDSVQQFSYSLDDKECVFSSSEERNNMSSDMLRKTSFISDIMETEDFEISLESPPGTPKLPIVLKKGVPHSVINDRIDEHEHAGTNIVKMTDDEIDNAIENVYHDHYYYISKPSENNNVRSLIISGNALTDHAYAKVSPLRKRRNVCQNVKNQENSVEAYFNPAIKCSSCEEKFYGVTDFLQHFQEQHKADDGNGKAWFKCSHCEIRFYRKKDLENHLAILRESQPDNESTDSADSIPTFMCNYCNFEYIHKRSLLKHIKRKHTMKKDEIEVEIWKCEYCLSQFKFKENWWNHVQIEHAVRKETESAESEAILKCCDKEFYLKDLLIHIQERHLDTLKEAQGIQEESIDMLEGSDFQFQFESFIAKGKQDKPDSMKIKENSNNTENILKLKCCCKKIFHSKNDWIFHFQEQHVVDNGNRNHSKPFKCYHCGKVFKRKGRLLKHVSRLQSDNESTDSADSIPTYTCNYCNLEYYHKSSLLAHIKNKHTVRNDEKSDPSMKILKCKYCPKEYKRNQYLSMHVRREHVIYRNTESPENKLTLKCGKEFSSERYMLSQFHNPHLGIREQPQSIQGDSKYSRSSTQDESSDIQQESLDIQEESQDIQDEPLDIQQDSQDIQEEPLDIKPEIFQCSKCPSSFLNEEEMSKHLQIMHGNLIDLYIDKLNCNKRDTRVNKDTSSLLVAKQCENDDERQTALQDIYSGYNFAELETDIKKEFSDPLEDIHLPYEEQFGLNFILEQNFSENEYNIDTNVQEANDTELAKDSYPSEKETNFNPDTVTIKMESLDSENDLCNNFDIISGQNDNLCVNPEIIKCKSCQMTFPNQEELLDHMHDLINTKAKLYADAKQVLKTNCVQFKDPNTSYDKPCLNESELLDNIHRVYDKSEKKQFNLEIVGENRIEVEENDCVNQVDPSICRCCSKHLPIKVRIGKYDKICKKCKRIEKRNENRRKSVKSQYACAKNKQFKQHSEFKSETCENKPKTLSDAEILKNMNRFFNKRLKKMNHSSNRSKTNCIFDKIDVKKETLEGTLIFEDNDNDLLKPLREEEEKIIVQPHDPMLCKSCLVPLEVTETTGKNKTINIFCDKCKASKTHNEKRRKSNEKRRKSNGNKIDKTLSKRNSELSCLICRCKFRNKLALRKHVARSHL